MLVFFFNEEFTLPPFPVFSYEFPFPLFRPQGMTATRFPLLACRGRGIFTLRISFLGLYILYPLLFFSHTEITFFLNPFSTEAGSSSFPKQRGIFPPLLLSK